MKTRHEILMEDPEYRRLYAIEGLVTGAAELVARLMEQQGVNKAELARRLGKSRAWATQLLNGKANMTMRTFAAVVHALGAEVKLTARSQAARSTNLKPHARSVTIDPALPGSAMQDRL
ncbi:MAG: helix-turn-helix transcriptional regulator [Bryobacteraceae bacterium]|jgi:transcriptional regulator with XRE-family HTH domain